MIEADYDGHCPICEKDVRFLVQGPWLRDQLLCAKCGSIPRERALFSVLRMLFPNWRDLSIHESSPVDRGASLKLRTECAGYVSTQFDPGAALGCTHQLYGWRNEDLEHQTFDTGSFDIVVTQDVFEHLFHPDIAIREIARTLKPGGASVMSVPIVQKEKPSKPRALMVDGQIKMLGPEEWHGNPVPGQGALVTQDWGYDITDYLWRHSGMPTSIYYLDDVSRGIRAEFIEIIVSRKLT
jgi:SAM-dependent methyltransferase